jgi:hypothetical protein
MRLWPHVAVVLFMGLFLSGCDNGQSSPAQPSMRTEGVNKQHIKGSTRVLRDYRFGESVKQQKRKK